MREIGDIVRKYEGARAERYALATLVRALGSSYRQPGARMLVAPDGSAVGSLSGGCLEAEVTERARDVIRSGEPQWMTVDTRRRFGCSGTIEILIEAVRPAVLEALADGARSRRRVTVGTCFGKGSTDVGSRVLKKEDARPPDMLVQRINPPVQLLMIGGGPDSVALRSFAETLGWKVLEMEGAGELEEHYDPWTAAVIKTHNYGRDFAALRALLPMGLRYVGLVGARKRRDQLLGDMLDTGLVGTENLYAPAGLGLGGESPEAIALAIIAEIQSIFEGGAYQPLRDRRAPIHGRREEPLAIVAA